MSAAVAAIAGWATAGLAVALALLAQRALDGRREAIARACHELRGPLTAARLGLSLGEGSGELSDVRRRAIDGELRRAALALDDLTRVPARDRGGSRLGAPRPGALERVDIAELAAAAVHGADGQALHAGVGLELVGEAAGAAVWGDRMRLGQALGNLIANAIEHGGSDVTVALARRSGTVRVTVSDGGAGIPAPVSELARRPRAGRGARGRGLAIAVGIAQSHGGTVSAAPSARGARVILELPTAASLEAGAGGRAG